MNYEPSKNVTFSLAILNMVFLPMVAKQVGRLPLSEILNQVEGNDRPMFAQGIEALAELQLLVMHDGEVCITNRSEGFLQAMGSLSGVSKEAVDDIFEKKPDFKKFLSTIDAEKRLTPPESY